MDLGKTTLVKHSIRLTDNTPFQGHYWQIPINMHEEIRKHLKEMLEIVLYNHPITCGLAWSYWYRRKRVNVCMIKDSYSLSRIEDTLYSLNRAVWFTALDFKSGYWQVEMDEVSKPFMAFMVGLLGFYECDNIPFGLGDSPEAV